MAIFILDKNMADKMTSPPSFELFFLLVHTQKAMMRHIVIATITSCVAIQAADGHFLH